MATPESSDRPAASGVSTEPDAGGDPACWAHQVCQQCGRLNDAQRPEVCESCAAPFPDFD